MSLPPEVIQQLLTQSQSGQVPNLGGAPMSILPPRPQMAFSQIPPAVAGKQIIPGAAPPTPQAPPSPLGGTPRPPVPFSQNNSALAPAPQQVEQGLLETAATRAAAMHEGEASAYERASEGASTYKDFLNSIAQRLTQTPVGPSDAERYGRLAQAMGGPNPTGTFGGRMANVGGASADVLAQQREQDLQKQMLIAKYQGEGAQMGMQIPMLQAQRFTGMANAADTRAAQLAARLGTQGIQQQMADMRSANAPVINVNGVPQTNQAAVDAQSQLAAAKAASAQKAKMDLYKGLFSPEALDLVAEQAYRTGKPPQIPYGITRNDPTAYARAMDMVAAKAAADGNSAAQAVANQQTYHAAGVAMTALTKQATITTAYEKSAEKAFDTALRESDNVARLGSPFLNQGIIAFKRGIKGDTNTGRMVDAITAAQTEYARVLSGAMGSAAITDSARDQAKDLFSKIDSADMLRGILGQGGTGREIMHNRTSSFNDQQQVLQDLMTRHGPGQGQIAGNVPGSTAKTVTKAQVQDYATKHNLPYAAALTHATTNGYTVQ